MRNEYFSSFWTSTQTFDCPDYLWCTQELELVYIIAKHMDVYTVVQVCKGFTYISIVIVLSLT